MNKRALDRHTDRMLCYHLGKTMADSHWRCRRCGRRFSARAAARREACAPLPARTTEPKSGEKSQ